jgi:hypothetical protein
MNFFLEITKISAKQGITAQLTVLYNFWFFGSILSFLDIFGVEIFPYFHKKIDEIFSIQLRCHDPRSNIHKRKYLFQIPGGRRGATTVPISCIGLVISCNVFVHFSVLLETSKGKMSKRKVGWKRWGEGGLTVH